MNTAMIAQACAWGCYKHYNWVLRRWVCCQCGE